MNIIAIVAALVIGLLIFNSMRNADPEAQACAQDIVALLKQNRDAKAADYADVLKRHGRNASNAGEVLKLIKPKLIQAGIRKEDQLDVLTEIRKAKQYLEL